MLRMQIRGGEFPVSFSRTNFSGIRFLPGGYYPVFARKFANKNLPHFTRAWPGSGEEEEAGAAERASGVGKEPSVECALGE